MQDTREILKKIRRIECESDELTLQWAREKFERNENNDN